MPVSTVIYVIALALAVRNLYSYKKTSKRVQSSQANDVA